MCVCVYMWIYVDGCIFIHIDLSTVFDVWAMLKKQQHIVIVLVVKETCDSRFYGASKPVVNYIHT